MNKIILIGNLTRDPELRTTQNGSVVCSFTIAVNRRSHSENKPDADFFRVSTWKQLAELCNNSLKKGKKVCVVGSVSASAYITNDGTPKASMDVNAEFVEFLSPKEEKPKEENPKDDYTPVNDEELPFDR